MNRARRDLCGGCSAMGIPTASIGRLRVYANVSSSASNANDGFFASGSKASGPAVDPELPLDVGSGPARKRTVAERLTLLVAAGKRSCREDVYSRVWRISPLGRSLSMAFALAPMELTSLPSGSSQHAPDPFGPRYAISSFRHEPH